MSLGIGALQLMLDRAAGPPEEIEDTVIRVLADALICRSGGTGAVSKSVVVLTRNRGFEPLFLRQFF